MTTPEPRSGLREPLLAWAGATAVASALFWIAQGVPLVQRNLHGAIAVVFLYGPALAARLSGRPFEYRAAGLRLDPVALNLKVLGLALAITWPVFLASFLLFYGYVCQPGIPRLVQDFAEVFAPVCAHWRGLGGATWRLPEDFALLALSQVVVVALPEELFFRGYLLGRLEQRWPSTRRLFGAPVGWPLLVSSALFAFGHVLVDFDPQRLAVFFPALAFGWMRARTGSIAAPTTFHALCNLLSAVLHVSFFA